MGIRLETARAFFKSERDLIHWSVGNVGVEAIANPVLYPRIIENLVARSAALRGERLRMVDFGAGSLRLERDLYCEDPSEVFGLRNLDPALVDAFRAAPVQALAYEASDSLLRMGRAGLPDELAESGRVLVNGLDPSSEQTTLGNSCVDLAVSRNLMMGLSPPALRYHLCEVLRVLKPGRPYLSVVLNPEYQRRKIHRLHPELSLTCGQSFRFPRGDDSSLEYTHYFYRSLDYVDFFSQAGFEVADVELLATPNGWEDRIPRYYYPFAPVFLLITAFKV